MILEAVFGNITNEHKALKEKYFNTRKQDSSRDGNDTANSSADRDDDGDDGNIHTYIHTYIYVYTCVYTHVHINYYQFISSGGVALTLLSVDDNTLSIEAELVRLRKEKIQYEDLISKQEQYIDETEKIVNRANAERDALAETVELMKVEIEGKDSEITQLKLQLKRANTNPANSSSPSISSSPRTSSTSNQQTSDADALRIELEKRMNESLAQANELKRVKDLVNTQIAGNINH